MSIIRKSDVIYPAKEEAYAIIGLSGEPIPRATIGITNPFPGYAITHPANESRFNFEYVIEGKGEVLLNGVWQRVSAGDTYLLMQNELQVFRSDGKSPWKKIWINFSCPYMAQMVAAFSLSSGVYRVDTSHVFAELFSIAKSGGADANFRISECLTHLLAMVSAARERMDNRDAHAVYEELCAAVYRKCTLTEIAEKLHLSKATMIRSFKKAYGVSPYAFLLERKIAAAKVLLQTQMTVKEVAAKLAFPDEHYFSSVFLQKVGVRPGEYKKTAR
ncbi:MAG: AraC family transcriptional regulator [Clostridia bacterium]|nr:AraC family transcriptional regulator [Clostridia bacterium]